MKNLLLLFPILLLLTFSSCFKPNEDGRETAYLPEDFKSYTVFNEGTWWVYEEVFSGERDSSFVFSSITEINTDDKRAFIREEIDQLLLRRKDTIYCVTFPFTHQSERNIYIYIYIEKNISEFPSSMNLLSYPIDSIDQQVPFQGGAFVTAIEEETIIKNQTYYNTIHVSFDGAVAENGNPLWRIRSCTFAPNVGMIRIQYYDGTIWELVDYHIER